MVDGCFLIKSYFGRATGSAKILMDRYNLREPDYSFLLTTNRKRDFKENYYHYLWEASKTLIKDKYGFDAAAALDVRHIDFWNVECCDIHQAGQKNKGK